MCCFIVQVVSKRRKVVKDLVSNVVTDFVYLRGLEKDQAWKALGPEALGGARICLEGVLKPLHTEKPEYYNDDAQLGAAINDAVFLGKAIRGWDEGTAALVSLASLSGHVPADLIKLETLELTVKTGEKVWDGIGALLSLGRLQVLNLGGAGLGAAGAKRLAVELGKAPRLTELKCVNLPLI